MFNENGSKTNNETVGFFSMFLKTKFDTSQQLNKKDYMMFSMNIHFINLIIPTTRLYEIIMIQCTKYEPYNDLVLEIIPTQP